MMFDVAFLLNILIKPVMKTSRSLFPFLLLSSSSLPLLSLTFPPLPAPIISFLPFFCLLNWGCTQIFRNTLKAFYCKAHPGPSSYFFTSQRTFWGTNLSKRNSLSWKFSNEGISFIDWLTDWFVSHILCPDHSFLSLLPVTPLFLLP